MSNDLARPNREPDYISSAGTKYWFEELIREIKTFPPRKIHLGSDNKLYSSSSSLLYSKAVQDAYKDYINKQAEQILLDK